MPPKLLHAVDLSRGRHIREGEQKAASEQGLKRKREPGHDGIGFIGIWSLCMGKHKTV